MKNRIAVLFIVFVILALIFSGGTSRAKAQEFTHCRGEASSPTPTPPPTPTATPATPPAKHKTYLPIVLKGNNQMTDDFDLWWIVVPESTTNIVTNPSVETNTTGYAIINAFGGGNIAQSSAYQKRGVYSIKVTPSAGLTDGVKYSITLDADTWYTFSVDVKGHDTDSYVVDMYDTVALASLDTLTFTSDGGWARYALTAKTGANTAIELRVYKNSDANTFGYYVDGFQVEQKLYATDYCDGDQDGCSWSLAAHASQSTRAEQFSGAGRPVSLYDYGYNVGTVIGAGMTTIEITAQRPALGDGTEFRKQSFRERITSLPGFFDETDLMGLHTSRSTFLQLLNPNRFATQQPVHIRYSGSGKMLDCAFYYQDGMGGQNEGVGCGSEIIPLRLYAADPYWKQVDRIFDAVDIANGIGTGADGSSGAAGVYGGGGGNAALDAEVSEDIADADYILMKDSTGAYSDMDGGLSLPVPGLPDADVYAIAVGPDGKLYIGGAFNSVGAVANTDSIAYWDGSSWNAMGTGTNGDVYAIAIDQSDGTVYIGGDFALAGGVANTVKIAYWDGAAWNAMGTGSDDSDVKALAIDSSGNVYAGGAFTGMGGVANTAYIAKWNGAAWSAMGTGGNSDVEGLDVDSLDNVYAGGSFLLMGGVANTVKAAKWNGAAWSAMGTGADDNTVYAVNVDPDDCVYFGGTFTGMGGVANTTRVAKWNGTAWSALDTGADDGGVLSISSTGNVIYIGGSFSTVSGIANTARVAYWDGADWYPLTTGANNTVYGTTVSYRGELYIVGVFGSVGGYGVLDYIARWSGVDWHNIAMATLDIVQDYNGGIYIGGGFINAGGEANADAVAYYNPTTEAFSALSTGADSTVNAMAVSANGDVYAGGIFSSMAGIANTQGIACWDTSASTWVSIGDINGSVIDIAIAPNGDIYIGGLFLDAGGVANTANIAYYDISGATWVALSAEPNGAVSSLSFMPDGTLIIGGIFTKIGATSYDYIAKYTPSTDTFSALENGTNGYINTIDVGPDGSIYIGGTFTQAGSVSANFIAKWNGTAFSPLGSGINNNVYVIRVEQSSGLVWVGGAFTSAGDIAELPDKVAIWNGTNWTPIDVNLPGIAAVEAILLGNNGTTVLCFDTSGTATAAAVN